METTEKPLRIIGYVRVSTDKQDIGPEVQIDALKAEAARTGVDLTIVREDAASASTTLKRPLMLQALADLKAGRYDGLMVSKLDRLSRSTEDGTRILADSTRQGWRLICLDLGVDTAEIMGGAMFGMALNFAEVERRMIGKRTMEAMARIKAGDETTPGKHMGRKSKLPVAVMERIDAEREAGATLAAIAQGLNDDGVPTSTGKEWKPMNVRQVLVRRTKTGGQDAVAA